MSLDELILSINYIAKGNSYRSADGVSPDLEISTALMAMAELNASAMGSMLTLGHSLIFNAAENVAYKALYPSTRTTEL